MVELKKQNANSCFIELMFNTLIEVSSFLDFISDFYILKSLASSTDIAWFTFALFTMICPYYTIYTSLINHQITIAHKYI